MTLRLVLVGMVATFGITGPTNNTVAGWAGRTQTWLISRMAEWDNRSPGESEMTLIKEIALESRLAQMSHSIAPKPSLIHLTSPSLAVVRNPIHTLRNAPTAAFHAPLASRSFQPMEIAIDRPFDVADELNRDHEAGFTSPRASVRLERSAPDFKTMEIDAVLYFANPLTRLDRAIASRQSQGQFGSLPSFHEVSRRMIHSWNLWSGQLAGQMSRGAAWTRLVSQMFHTPVHVAPEPLTAHPTFESRLDTTESFRSMERTTQLYFVESPANSSFSGTESKRIDRSSIPVARFDPIEPSDELMVGVAYELNRRGEGLGTEFTGLRQAESMATSIATHSVAPRKANVSAEKSRPEKAAAISKVTEGTGQTSAAAGRPQGELKRAVILTRDAVFAWVDVLNHGRL